jgi:ATP-binding cassette subfamily B protein
VHDDEILGKAYDARLMRRLLQYLRPYWRQVGVALGAIIVGSAASLAQPYLIKVAIDRYIAAGRLDGLDRIALIYLVILVAAFAAEYVQTWSMQFTGQRIMFDLRMAIYGHLQRLDLRFYDRNPVGRLMTRVTSDVDVLNDLFTSGVVTVFSDVLTLVGIMVMMLVMNWRLALVTFAVLPIIVGISQWFRKNVRDSYRVVRGWIARINAFLQENITGMATVQLFRREALNFQRFDDIDRKHRDANIDSIFYYAVFYPAVEAVSSLAAALIIWYGGIRHLGGALTIGSVVAFLQYSQRFFRPISDMSEKFNILQAAMASSERIFKLLDEPVAIASPAVPAVRPAPAAGDIAFEHVWFAYNDENFVLRDVSFDVKPGERVGIVGATGSGKTTLICCCGSTMSIAGASRSTAWTYGRSISRTCAACSASFCRTSTCFPARLRTTSGWVTPRLTTRGCAWLPAPSTRSRSSSGCRTGSTAPWRSADRRCRWARNSCCRSRALWRSTRGC